MTELDPLDRIFAESLLKKMGSSDEKTALAIGRLMHGSRAGHLCMQKEELGEEIQTLPYGIVEEGTTLFPKAPIVQSEGRYYLQKNWVYETYILQHVLRLRKHIEPDPEDPRYLKTVRGGGYLFEVTGSDHG